ncbi:MAG: outer membrane beta-barrel protein [Thiotrichales bacterium]|nr:MAG: outer membrane beta-barrel protein [Thiotrichales bacterium]
MNTAGIKLKSAFLLLPVLFVYSLAVSANGYFGVSFGNTSVKADLTSLGGGSLDESTGMSKLYGGYRFNKYVSAEAAWFNLASVSVAQVGTGPNAVSGAVDMQALGIYGVAYVPLGKRTNILVKAGGASWDADLTRNTTTESVDGFDAFYGLGFSYGFTKNLAFTADWEVINSPNPEFSTFSLGFRWDFK